MKKIFATLLVFGFLSACAHNKHHHCNECAGKSEKKVEKCDCGHHEKASSEKHENCKGGCKS